MRDSGHNRVPEPPHKITGETWIMLAAPSLKFLGLHSPSIWVVILARPWPNAAGGAVSHRVLNDNAILPEKIGV